MKNLFLFPNKYKKLGWILFMPAFIASLVISIFDINIDNYFVVKVFAFAENA